MSPLKILIADDEAPARHRLKSLLAEIPNCIVVGEAANGRDVLSMAAAVQPDVLLLDIRMPVMDGIEAAKHAQKLSCPPAIIFTTAYDAHAMQAFELHAVDYLLKPIRLDRLRMALARAHALRPAQMAAVHALSPQRTHFSIHERGRVLLVPVDDVLYLRAEMKYLTVRTAAREYLLEDSLTQIEQEFPHRFLRIHRNCLVNRDAVQGFERRREESGETHWVVLLKGLQEALPVSRRQQHLVRELGR
ncbi:MAG: LytTR family DNA-binding domain-containing protein [Methylophilaceae bacterium]|nr:LytTR family DNA-binding domain-containing protein [Methylophilaceae bacterium]